jgi:hypothetical protein
VSHTAGGSRRVLRPVWAPASGPRDGVRHSLIMQSLPYATQSASPGILTDSAQTSMSDRPRHAKQVPTRGRPSDGDVGRLVANGQLRHRRGFEGYASAPPSPRPRRRTSPDS